MSCSHSEELKLAASALRQGRVAQVEHRSSERRVKMPPTGVTPLSEVEEG